MNTWEILLMSVSVAMDAFAVSISKGLAARTLRRKDYLLVGVWFGGFQMLMPLVGYGLGAAFYNLISAYDHWVAFGLLAFVGIKMIVDSFHGSAREASASFAPRTMLVLAVATSIDALAIGITLAVTPGTNIAASVVSFGLVTFVLSALGLQIGHIFGAKNARLAGIAGGIILTGIGVRILVEGLAG